MFDKKRSLNIDLSYQNNRCYSSIQNHNLDSSFNQELKGLLSSRFNTKNREIQVITDKLQQNIQFYLSQKEKEGRKTDQLRERIKTVISGGNKKQEIQEKNSIDRSIDTSPIRNQNLIQNKRYKSQSNQNSVDKRIDQSQFQLDNQINISLNENGNLLQQHKQIQGVNQTVDVWQYIALYQKFKEDQEQQLKKKQQIQKVNSFRKELEGQIQSKKLNDQQQIKIDQAYQDYLEKEKKQDLMVIQDQYKQKELKKKRQCSLLDEQMNEKIKLYQIECQKETEKNRQIKEQNEANSRLEQEEKILTKNKQKKLYQPLIEQLQEKKFFISQTNENYQNLNRNNKKIGMELSNLQKIGAENNFVNQYLKEKEINRKQKIQNQAKVRNEYSLEWNQQQEKQKNLLYQEFSQDLQFRQKFEKESENYNKEKLIQLKQSKIKQQQYAQTLENELNYKFNSFQNDNNITQTEIAVNKPLFQQMANDNFPLPQDILKYIKKQ